MKKPLVKGLEECRWSSYPAYRNLVPCDDWLYKDTVFGELGSGRPTASYKRFVEQGIDEQTEQFYLRYHWPAVRGSEKFTDKAHLNSNASSKEVQKERDVVQAAAILKVVSVYYDCKREELLKSIRGGGVDNTARAMAMKLCQEHGCMNLAEMGTLFGIGSDSGVMKTISRFTQRLSGDDELSGVFNALYQELTP